MNSTTKWAQPISFTQKNVKIWLDNCLEIPTKGKSLLVAESGFLAGQMETCSVLNCFSWVPFRSFFQFSLLPFCCFAVGPWVCLSFWLFLSLSGIGYLGRGCSFSSWDLLLSVDGGIALSVFYFIFYFLFFILYIY